LDAYREAASRALLKLDGWQCVRMEDFGARAWDVDAFCRQQVKSCDLFIGIIGHRFGDGPKDVKESYTQREYHAAIEAKTAATPKIATPPTAGPGRQPRICQA